MKRVSLFDAANFNDVDAAQEFINKPGVDINARFSEGGYTALHIACNHGAADVARLLIENGADTSITAGSLNRTASQVADEFGYKELSNAIKNGNPTNWAKASQQCTKISDAREKEAREHMEEEMQAQHGQGKHL